MGTLSHNESCPNKILWPIQTHFYKAISFHSPHMGHDKTKFRTKDCVLMLFPPTSPCLILPFPCDQIPMPQGLRRSNGQIARSHLRSGPPQLHLTFVNFRPLTLMVHSSDGLFTQWCFSWNTVQRVNS